MKLEKFSLVKFSNLEWYVIGEDEDTLTLFLKDKQHCLNMSFEELKEDVNCDEYWRS